MGIQPEETARRRRFAVPMWALAAAFCAAALVYALFDPAESAWMPKCMFRMVTGWDCPGCGMQRMAHALLHGDLAAAFGYNACLFCLLPVMAVMVVAEGLRNRMPRLYRLVYHPAVSYAILIIILIWFPLRNLLGI